MVLRNYYGVDMGTSGLIIQAQSLAEILADKLIAFALRPNRVKNRDIWDIGWLKQQNIELPLELIPKKIADHRCHIDEYLRLLAERIRLMRIEPSVRKAFTNEMKRFLPAQTVFQTVENPEFWEYLTSLIEAEGRKVISYLSGSSNTALYIM